MIDANEWTNQQLPYLRTIAGLAPDAPLPDSLNGSPVFYMAADGTEFCTDCANQSDAEPAIVYFQTIDSAEETRHCNGCGHRIPLDAFPDDGQPYDPRGDVHVGEDFRNDAGEWAHVNTVYEDGRGDWYVSYSPYAAGEMAPDWAPLDTEQTIPASMFVVEYNAI